MLKRCCCCISLRTGCIIIAAIYICIQISTILNTKKVLDSLEEEENEDEENKEQREAVQTISYFVIVLASFKIGVGIAIIFATYMELPILLKVCAGIIVAGAFIPFLVAALDNSGRSSLSYIVEAFDFVIAIYGACVLWSFADGIENPEMPLRIFVLPEPFPTQ